MLFRDPETGREYEGYDPTARDARGNRVGSPTGRTHGVLFFDYDDDGDPDLWVASDGDRLHLFRNDSSPGNVRFTPVGRAMGIDKVGNWMGFRGGRLRWRCRSGCFRHERRLSPSHQATMGRARRVLRIQ